MLGKEVLEFHKKEESCCCNALLSLMHVMSVAIASLVAPIASSVIPSCFSSLHVGVDIGPEDVCAITKDDDDVQVTVAVVSC